MSALMRQIVEHSPVGAFAFDTGGFIYVNQAFADYFGYSVAEILACQDHSCLIHVKDRPHFTRYMQGYLVGNEQEALVEFRGLHRDGHHIDCEIFTCLIEHRGKPVLVGTLQDVSTRKSLEGQLLRAQRLEAVGRLAGGVAHDFNNMLTVIQGYCSSALERLHRQDPVCADMEEALKAAERSAALTRQLLAFSRRQAHAPRKLAINGHLQELQQMLQRLIGEDVELSFVAEAALWPVHLDPAQLEQVVVNLAINSRDAMPAGGKLTIETQNVVLDEQYCASHLGTVPGEYVLVAVSDNGSGMDRKTLARACEPFFTTKEAGQGTGLGLSTVYGIVRQNNGHLNIYSEPGQGTTVKVYLPRHSGQPDRQARVEDNGPLVGGQETVLVVEDEPQLLRLVSRLLEGLGYRVLQARGGGEALLLGEQYQHDIDLLLTDVVMPALNGKELFERLAAGRPGLRVVYMSGYTVNAIVHRGLLQEDAHYLQKPFDRDTLGRKVRQVLDED